MGFLEPKLEVHAPDLYIPLMAFMSYVLISCLSMGIGDQLKSILFLIFKILA